MPAMQQVISRRLRLFLAAPLLLLLSACGGGGGGSGGGTPAPPSPPPAPTRHALNVTLSGGGKVTSSPAGIDCGSTCSASFDAGTQVTLTASPASGQVFTGWSGDCSGSAASCTVAMSQARSVGAAFAPIRYTLSVSLFGSGSVSSSPAGISCGSTCSASFDAGTQVTLTASPASGQVFTGWSGDCSGSAASCTVAMSQARSVGARFDPAPGATYTFNGVAFPWRIWQPQTPTTPPSTTGKTYYVSPKGSDSNNGLSPATAFATAQKAANVAQAGDTVLFAAGLYRGTLYVQNSGQPGKPITFGSDGSGPVIIDVSTPVTGWTQVSGSVWKATASFTPVAVVVNNVPLKQVTSATAVTSGSGAWYLSGQTITADFGNSTPAQADIVVPSNNGSQTAIGWYNLNYLVFNGLTARGAGAGGIQGYGSNVTVSNCVAEFNAKAGIAFMEMQGNANSGNQALYNLVYQNVLLNWPRGNNGYANAGGGWSGGLVFSYTLNGIARGNIVYDNGGEGIISFGQYGGTPATGNTLFEQNVAFDNWSMNMYISGQPGGVARQNILFNHPMDPATLMYPANSSQWATGVPQKYTVCFSLSDEYEAATNGVPVPVNTQVYDNLMAGCRIGIMEYAEGNPTIRLHTLKGALIANNTILLPPTTPAGTFTAGMYFLDNATPNSDTVVANNLIYAFDATEPVIMLQGPAPVPGITFSNNVYYNPATPNVFATAPSGSPWLTFAQWQARGADAAGAFANPALVGADQFRAIAPIFYDTGRPPYDPANAKPRPGSILIGAGKPQSQYNYNLEGAGFIGTTGYNAGAY